MMLAAAPEIGRGACLALIVRTGICWGSTKQHHAGARAELASGPPTRIHPPDNPSSAPICPLTSSSQLPVSVWSPVHELPAPSSASSLDVDRRGPS